MRFAMYNASSKTKRAGFTGKSLMLLEWMAIILVLIFIHQVGLVDGDSPRTIIVDDDGEGDYETIQEAIDAAEDGDTIRVWEGTYYENVVVKKTLNLVGNGSEETTINASGNLDTMKITADWVNVSGFMVKGSGSDYGDAGIRVESNNNTISNNTFSDNNIGLYVYRSDNNSITNNRATLNYGSGYSIDHSNKNTITNNTASSNEDVGFNLFDSYNNTITHNAANSNGISGIYLIGSRNILTKNNASDNNFGIELLSSNNNTISNNTVNFNKYYGIQLNDSPNNTIANNTFNSNNYHGIILHGSNNNIITNNTAISNRFRGTQLSNSNNNTLENNTFGDNEVGILVTGSSSNNTAHSNIIYDNTDYGIEVSDSDGITINATNNWWGDNSGPFHPGSNPTGKGEIVSDNVEFDPWTRMENLTDITYYVDDDSPAGGDGSKERPFNTIQDAIDGPWSEYTIRVWEGVYYENIIVDKTLIILGNSSSSTLINGTGEGSVIIVQAENVIISGFRITSSGGGGINAGIYIQAENCTITRCNVTGNDRFGIFLRSVDNASLRNNTFYIPSSTGIILTGSNNNAIINNTYRGSRGQGIALDSNSNDNIIAENHCFGLLRSIWLYSSYHNIITNNTLENCTDVSIELKDSNHNTIKDNVVDTNSKAIRLSRSHHITMENNTLTNEGLKIIGSSLEYWNTHNIDASNTVNGRPLYYLSNRTGGSIPNDAGQVILANGSLLVIENQNWSEMIAGIQVGFSQFITIANSTCSNNNFYGIDLSYSDNNIIINNTCNNNVDYGIVLDYSHGNSVINNLTLAD